MAIHTILIQDLQNELNKIKLPQFMRLDAWSTWNDNSKVSIKLTLLHNEFVSPYDLAGILPATIKASLKRGTDSILKDVHRKILHCLPELEKTINEAIDRENKYKADLNKNLKIFQDAGLCLVPWGQENEYHIDNDFQRKLSISSDSQYCRLDIYGLDESQLIELAKFLKTLKKRGK